MNTSTIAACSTGAMPCAIAAVRLSGPLAKEIADGIFQVKGEVPFSARKARTMHYGKFYAKDGALLDFGLVWNLADIFNALMAIPNLLCLLFLSNVLVSETRKYLWNDNLDEEGD